MGGDFEKNGHPSRNAALQVPVFRYAFTIWLGAALGAMGKIKWRFGYCSYFCDY